MTSRSYLPRSSSAVDRRRFLQLGGLGAASAALLAACGAEGDSAIARVGVAPTTTALPDAVVDDAVLLRTASSIEYTAISIYDLVIGNTDLLDPANQAVAERLRDDHREHAAAVEALTAEIGGEPWTCGNPRLEEVVVPAILRAVLGAPATDDAPAVAPSDDPRRDVLHIAHAFEAFAGSTYQSLVAALTTPELRREAIRVAQDEVRHAALLAIAITGRPAGYVNPADVLAATGVAPAAAETSGSGMQVPPVYAVPGQFGNLGAIPLVIGAQDEVGNRAEFSLDTPSLNTFVYAYLTPSC